MPDLTDYLELTDATIRRQITNQSGRVYVQMDFWLGNNLFRRRWIQKIQLTKHDGKLWIPKWYAKYLLESLHQERQACRRCGSREVYAVMAEDQYWLRCARCHCSPPDKRISKDRLIEQCVPLRKLEDVLQFFSPQEREALHKESSNLTKFFEPD
jgi:hypothetical protein